jgi:hypothetical protein
MNLLCIAYVQHHRPLALIKLYRVTVSFSVYMCVTLCVTPCGHSFGMAKRLSLCFSLYVFVNMIYVGLSFPGPCLLSDPFHFLFIYLISVPGSPLPITILWQVLQRDIITKSKIHAKFPL